METATLVLTALNSFLLLATVANLSTIRTTLNVVVSSYLKKDVK